MFPKLQLQRGCTPSRGLSWCRWAGVLLLLSISCPEGFSQTTPRIEYVFPAGAARGSETEVQVVGEFLTEDVRLVVAGQGIEIARELGKQRFQLRIAPDAAPGPRELRLVATQGASSPFPFLIGELPETTQDQPPQAEPTSLPLRTIINGRLRSAGQIDHYTLDLTAGQTIVCAVQTRALRSPLEPVLRLLDPDRTVVASSQETRTAEALLVHRASVSGRFALQLFDFQLNGSPAFVYRLVATDGPWLENAFPSALTEDRETELILSGWNLPGGLEQLKQTVPGQSVGEFSLQLAPSANQLVLPVESIPSFSEVEPNEDPTSLEPLSTPVIIHGRIEMRSELGDLDCYVFKASKGQTWLLDVDAADFRSPLDAVLTVFDEAGKKLVEVDDFESSRDPLIRFTAPTDGLYRLAIRDRADSGGADFIYRLRVTAPRPDVSLRVNTPSVYIETGATASVPVVVHRLDGFAETLELSAVDLPAGVSVTPQAIPEKTPATLSLLFSASEQVVAAGGLIRIVARSPAAGSVVEREAKVADSPAPTAPTSRYLWVAVGPPIPFTLKTTTTILEAPRMAAFPFPVQAERKAGFRGPIRLVGVEPDKRGTVLPLYGIIPAESDQGAIPLVIQHKVTEGTTHRCRVMGVADIVGSDGKSYQLFHVAPGAMAMGCQPSWLTMVAQPSRPTWHPGQTVDVEIQLSRRFPLEPISIRLEPPPGTTGIQCEPVTVPTDASKAKLTLFIAPDAQLSPRATFTVHAESSRKGQPVFGETHFRLDRE